MPAKDATPASRDDQDHYDAIVIGAGQGGGPLAAALGRAGRRTAMIEREHAGGTCINEGCTPTKTMISSGRVAYLARRGPDYGVEAGEVRIDLEKVRERKRAIVASFREGSERRLSEAPNLDYLEGEARFVGPKTAEVALNAGGTRRLTADLVFINAGARPAKPRLPGIETVPSERVLDSTTIMELDEVPDRLLVLGGGVVGVEFGQLFQRLGAAVTIVQRGPRLLGREDPDVADALADVLREDGIELLFETTPTAIATGPRGGLRLTVASAEGERTLDGDYLLAAAGRTPNSDRLDPAAAGIRVDERGFIPVNDRLETNVPGVYALGDINGGPAFTHISYDDYRIVTANLLDGGNRTTADRPVPYAVFTDPQLGRVGLTETEARAKGRAIRVARMPMSHVARALEVDEPRGLMKAVVDAETDQILGAAILGLEGGELMAMLEIAMMGKLPYTALRDGVFAHPTLAESLNNLFGSWAS
jgi:pyruvate/2-oxoglutarate dehydrogenase complex dihydrolipoamide dehydrogenase (E3) component